MQQVHRLAGHLHAAAGMMAEGGNAIDIRVFGQTILGEIVGDGMDHGGRAIYCRDDGDEVAGAGAAIGAHVSLEASALCLGQNVNGFEILSITIVALKLPKLHIVIVQHGAGHQVRFGKTNGHVVFQDRLALGDVVHRQLIARRYDFAGHHIAARDCRAGGDLLQRHRDIVRRVQSDCWSARAFILKSCHDFFLSTRALWFWGLWFGGNYRETLSL